MAEGKPSLFEMQVVIGDEADRMEIVGEALRMTGAGGLGDAERRRVLVYRRAVEALRLVETHEHEFAEIIRKRRNGANK